MPHFAASDLVLHCLPMTHKKDARLIWSKQPFKRRPKLVFNTNYRLMQVKSTFDLHKLLSVFKTFVLSIFEWPLTVCLK